MSATGETKDRAKARRARRRAIESRPTRAVTRPDPAHGDRSPPIAVIGGGWAGCAAAVTLATEGIPVVLYETAAVLGGRARRVERDGFALDNGQHLLLGAYDATLAMLARVHGEQRAGELCIRRPLAIASFASSHPDALTLLARRAPGRLGLLVGLLSAGGLSFRERIANLAWFRTLERSGFEREANETVAALLAPLPPRVTRLLWEPLCLAALNTPIASASAQVFASLLRAVFAGRGDASDFVLPAIDLSALFPDAAATYVAARGGGVRLGTRAQVVVARREGATIAAADRTEDASAVIVAVGPHQLRQVFTADALAASAALRAALDALDMLDYEPLVTLWLGYAARVPMPGPVARLDDAPGQWVIDRPDILARAKSVEGAALAQMLSVVISADGPHMAIEHGELARAVDAQLRRLQPTLPPCLFSQVIAEKRATYACTPQRVRPAGARLAPGLYLAGDYADTVYPATLEAAVRSGIAAAHAVRADCAQARATASSQAGYAGDAAARGPTRAP